MASSSQGDLCNICGTIVVNFTGWRNVETANCLTMQLVEDVLKADWFESHVRSGVVQRFPSRVNDRQRRVDSCSMRSRCDNSRKAAKVVQRWKESGVNEHVRHYLQWNHVVLADFLRSHHNIDTSVTPENVVDPQPSENVEPVAPQQVSVVFEDASLEIDDCESQHSWSSVDSPDIEDEVQGCLPEKSYCSSFDDMSDIDSEVDECQATSSENHCIDGSQPKEEEVRYSFKKRRATHREVFEIFKAREFVTDDLMSKLLTYWRMYMPQSDWKNFTTNARNLSARTVRRHFKKFKIRKVVDGLKVTDGVPYHDREKREIMLARYDGPARTTIAEEKIKSYGDCVDFNLEESLLMEGPGILEPDKHLRLLRRLHAANPDLLSPHFLKIVDPVRYHKERLIPNKGRSKMNYFALKWHADGVQIAKNSTKANSLPISFAVDRVAPYDPDTQEVDASRCLIVPARLAPICTTTVFHGKGKCDLFQLTEHWHAEECRLHPSRRLSPGESRRLVVENRNRIGDSPIKAQFTGLKLFIL